MAKKQLFHLSEYLVDKSDKIIKNSPSLTPPLLVNHFKMLLSKGPHRNTGNIENAEILFNEIKSSTNNYLQHHELNFLSIKIYFLSREKNIPNFNELLKEIEDNDLISNYKDITNPYDKLSAFKIKYKVEVIKGNHELAIKLKQEEILFIESLESLIKLNPMNYLVPLNNIIEEFLKLEKYEDAKIYLKKMNLITKTYKLKETNSLNLAILSYKLPLEIKLLASLSPKDISLSDIENYKKTAIKFEHNNSLASLSHLANFYLAIALLKIQEYKKALRLLAIFEYENHAKSILTSYEVAVEISRMLIFYELEDTDGLHLKIRSFQRKNKNQLWSKEFVVLFQNLLKNKKDSFKFFNLEALKQSELDKTFLNIIYLWLQNNLN